MRLAYPIILEKGNDFGYVVYVPDFNINTEGKDLPDAIVMAKDAIEMMGVYLEDEKKDIPQSTNLSDVKTKSGEIKTLVIVDFDEYRKKTETKTVRRNVTLPSWLNYKADQANINVSAVLQKALKDKLGV